MPRAENDTVPSLYSLQYEQIKHLEILPEELARLSQEQAKGFDSYYTVTYGDPYFAARRGESWIVRKRDLTATEQAILSDMSGVRWTAGISILLSPRRDASHVLSLLRLTEDYASCLVRDRLLLIPTEQWLVEQVKSRLIEQFVHRPFSKEDLERAAREGLEACTIVTLGLREFDLLNGQALDDLLILRATVLKNIRFFWRIVGHGCATVHIQVTVDPKEVLSLWPTI